MNEIEILRSCLEQEVQARRQAEALAERKTSELREIERRLRDAMECLSEGFALYDAEDRLLIHNSKFPDNFNPAVKAILAPGVSFETIIRETVRHGPVACIDGDVDTWLQERLERHRKPTGPFIEQRRNGRWVQINERKTEDGCTVAVYSDLTEHKRTEHALREAKEAAEEAARAKSRFLANMSHELRTPLNAIIGIAEMLQEEAEELAQADWAEPLTRIHGAGNRLLMLINDILDFSKLDVDRLPLHPERFAVSALVHEVAQAAHAAAEQKYNRLEYRCPTGLGTMYNDPARVRQLLLNLLSNACKFTERGEIVLEAVRERRADQDWVVFTVSDTGIGMNQEQKKRLFQAFTQIDASTTRKHGGAGLGLVLSQRLCRLMGGKITVDSRLNTGTTFTVQLPATVTGVAKAAVGVVHAIRDGGT